MACMIRKSLVVMLMAWSLSASAERTTCAASVHASPRQTAVVHSDGQLRSHSARECGSTAGSLLAWAELSDTPDGHVDSSFTVVVMCPGDSDSPVGLAFPEFPLRISLVSQHVRLQI